MPEAAGNPTIVLPTWDLIITLMLIVGIGYGVILQRERILATLVGVYVGMVVAQNWGPSVYQFLSGNTILFDQLWIKANASPFAIKALLFGLIVVFLTIKSDFSQSMKESNAPLSGLMVIAYSFLTTTLTISAILSFLPPAQLNAITIRSNLADFLVDNFILWLVLPVIAMIIGGYLSGSSRMPTKEE
jgi:hypothetical protein